MSVSLSSRNVFLVVEDGAPFGSPGWSAAWHGSIRSVHASQFGAEVAIESLQRDNDGKRFFRIVLGQVEP